MTRARWGTAAGPFLTWHLEIFFFSESKMKNCRIVSVRLHRIFE